MSFTFTNDVTPGFAQEMKQAKSVEQINSILVKYGKDVLVSELEPVPVKAINLKSLSDD